MAKRFPWRRATRPGLPRERPASSVGRTQWRPAERTDAAPAAHSSLRRNRFAPGQSHEPGKSDSRRSVSWLAGQHAARTFPGSPGQGRYLPVVVGSLRVHLRIAFAAYSCRDSCRIMRKAHALHSRYRREYMATEDQTPSFQPSQIGKARNEFVASFLRRRRTGLCCGRSGPVGAARSCTRPRSPDHAGSPPDAGRCARSLRQQRDCPAAPTRPAKGRA
jgi:hypothetical protein